ncbi:SEL1-like repeat protein [Simiduia agarivorans]|uniref:Sel1 repeat family protein n=1 Tax=Simiduia agarivorans (strain DSM 21679 / JCM 13881 / BCRC 17597 / SA1) TaxID=1117647 RepID=K4KE99_SIMAS|nr:tetratricopeptide repeat protein [Simiduia agarivorans]AFU97369.2 hypothetical protein M5M_00672 [Simiduia agarivorans SA1 = DSM 21679]
MRRFILLAAIFSSSLVGVKLWAADVCSDAKDMWSVVAESGSESLLKGYLQQYSSCPLFKALAQKELDALAELRARGQADSNLTEVAGPDSDGSADLAKCYKSGAMLGQFPDYDPVEFSKLDVVESLYFCQMALEQFPDNIDVRTLYVRALLKKKDYDGIDKILKPGVDANDGYALSLMGTYYRDLGKNEIAFDYFSRSAAQDNVYGYVNLGLVYDFGRGVRQDYQKARKNYEMANSKGAMMHSNLALLYMNGQGVEKDLNKAIAIFEAHLAAGGVDVANLGHIYHKMLPKKNIKNAIKYYTLAAEKDASDWSMNRLGSIFANEVGFLSAEKAIHWWGKAAEKGSSTAAYNLGLLYQGDFQVGSVDHEKKIRYFKLAAKLGSDDAYRMLGYFYFNGEGVVPNVDIAREYYEFAANMGNVKSQRAVGRIYYEQNNFKKARYWYEKAAEKGDEIALKLLAQMDE